LASAHMPYHLNPQVFTFTSLKPHCFLVPKALYINISKTAIA
jgi:hypothetical protein